MVRKDKTDFYNEKTKQKQNNIVIRKEDMDLFDECNCKLLIIVYVEKNFIGSNQPTYLISGCLTKYHEYLAEEDPRYPDGGQGTEIGCHN